MKHTTNLEHRMYCAKSKMSCLVYHSDGICPDVRDCEACKAELEPQENKKAEVDCNHMNEFCSHKPQEKRECSCGHLLEQHWANAKCGADLEEGLTNYCELCQPTPCECHCYYGFAKGGKYKNETCIHCQPVENDWEEEFNEYFMIISEGSFREPYPTPAEIKQFISKLLEKQAKDFVKTIESLTVNKRTEILSISAKEYKQRILKIIKGMGKYKYGEPTKSKEYSDCTCGYGYDDCECDYNQALSDLKQKLNET